MRSSVFSLLLGLAVAQATVPSWDWVDAPTKTIYYTPNVAIGVVYIATNLLYDLGQSVEVRSGSPPPGISWANYGSCSGSSLCTAYFGTPSSAAAGVYTTVVRAINGSETRDLTVEFRPNFAIQGTPANGVVGASYSSTFTLTGGVAPAAWQAASGSIPPGLSFDTSSGILSGTPTTAGSYTVTLSAIDSTPRTITRNVTIQVYSALAVSTSSLPAVTVGGAYSQTLASTGGTTPKTWSIASGALPAGISLNSSTGALTGTPTTSGAANFTAQIACCTTATASQSLSITVNPAPSITTTSLPPGAPNAVYSQTLAASDGTPPYAWSVNLGSLPPGLALSATGVISGTPTAIGTTNFVARVADASGVSATKFLSIQIQDQPSITTTSLPAVTVGQSVSTALAATGGMAPLTWSIPTGSLPTGLSLNTATGALTGSPTAAGAFSFTARVTDSFSQEANANLSWTVNAAPSITTTTLAATTVSASYSAALAATGGTGALTWTISAGALPAGITMNSSTGALSGTPSVAGTANFTVQVTDTNNVHATQALSLVVNARADITTSTLPDGVVGQPYSQTVAATGGTGALTWTHSNGTLPTGISLVHNSGVLSGTPSTSGNFTFMLQVADSIGVADVRSLTLRILDPPSITTSSLPALTVGQTVAASLAATSGTAPYTWSITSGALPAGLTLNTATGAITGTATAAGPATFTAQVTDAASLSATANLSWTVNAAPSITTTTLSATTVSATFSATLAATGGTGALTWSITTGALPAGITLNPATGALTGSPTTAGAASLTVQVTDTNNVHSTQALLLTVNPPPSVTTTTLTNGVVGTAYSQTIAGSGGTGTLTFTIESGSLPAGLTLTQAGLLNGTPTVAGNSSFTVALRDSLNVAGSRPLTLRILSLPAIITTSLPPATAGRASGATLAANSGTPPYTWSVQAGNLPQGVSLNASTAELTGAPAAPGDFAFTAKVTDSAGQEATAQLNWKVNPAPAITTASIPESTQQRPLTATVLSATGGTGTLTWSATGLPAGLVLSATGTLNGTPSASGASPVEFKVTDSNGAFAVRTITITVNSGLSVTTTTLTQAIAGTAYSQTLAATGGTGARTWALDSGTPPAGLSLSASGVLAGTPTEPGSFTIAVKVTDSLGATGTASLTLQVVETPTITTSILPAITVGQAITQAFAATRGQAPYQWSVAAGALPAGLQLAATGIVSGTATDAAAAQFTLRVRDNRGAEGTRDFTWKPNARPSVTLPMPQPLIAGRPIPAASLQYSGGTPPFSFTAQGLPDGIQMDTGSGQFSGMPTTPGAFDIQVSIRDANGVTGQSGNSWRVLPGLTITTTSVSPVTAGAPCSRPIAISGGVAPFRWFITGGALPAGMIAGAADGTLSGSPASSGLFQFTLRVQDSNGVEASQSFSLQVNPELSIAAAALAPLTSGQSLSHSFTASGGTPPLSWSLASGALPAGLSLNAQGVLSGQVTTTGAFTFDVLVRDANGAEAVRPFSLQVNPARELRLSPNTLAFEAFAGGPKPAPQQVIVSSTPSNSDLRLTSSAPWLTAALSQAQTPLVVNVTAVPDSLAPGKYSAQLTVEGPETKVVDVTLTIAEPRAPGLTAAPTALTLNTLSGAGPLRALLTLSSTAANPGWRATSDQPWLTLSPAEGLFDAALGATLTVTATPEGLAAGSHSANLTLVQGDTLLQVPVTLEVKEHESFELSYTGLTFRIVSGATAEPQTLEILNRASAPLQWRADTATPWLRLDASSGTADPVSPLSVSLDTSGLTPGSYQGQVTVTPISGGDPRTAEILLTITSRSLPPTVSPEGLLFLSLPAQAPGQQTIEPQTIRIANPGAAPVSFTASQSPLDASWLTLSRTSGEVPASGSLELTAQANATSLAPGMYRAQISIEFSDGTVRVVLVALRVVSAECQAGAPELAWVRLGEHFSVTAGQPASLAIRVTDNCGQPVSTGAGLVTFSREGERAVPLVPGPNGLWTATWTPLEPTPSLSLNLIVQTTGGLSGTLTATGEITAPQP